MEEIISVLKRKTKGSSSSSESAMTPKEKKPRSPSERTDEINMVLEMADDLASKIQLVLQKTQRPWKYGGRSAAEIVVKCDVMVPW